MTKKQEGMKWSYDNARYTTLWDAYTRPSAEKEKAYKNCLAAMEHLNGYDGRVTGKSCMFFSFAFRYMQNGAERLHYITYANDYDFAI